MITWFWLPYLLQGPGPTWTGWRASSRAGAFMAKTAIVTDSNSGITQGQAKEYGVYVLPMPFYIDGELYFEDGRHDG